MNKRKTYMSLIKEHKRQLKRRCLSLQLENSPVVNSIRDLITIGKTAKFYKNINTVMLWKIVPYLEQLDEMVGLQSLKETIFYQIIYYLQNMHTKNKNEDYLHTLILGPPGHGKTEVAKIIGGIYKAMGIISPTGTFTIAHRDDFVAKYLGQTALKTKKLLTSCIGGVIFIDELYALAPNKTDSDSFAKEAIDTLTSFLSEHKNDFCCIGAGYEEDIKTCFFNMNKGLERRFPWVHVIETYTSEELAEIFIRMINKLKWSYSFEKKDIEMIIENNKNLFKYAGGDIETFLSKTKIIHSKRVFSLNKEHRFIITLDDIQNTIVYIKEQNKTKEKMDFLSYMYV